MGVSCQLSKMLVAGCCLSASRCESRCFVIHVDHHDRIVRVPRVRVAQGKPFCHKVCDADVRWPGQYAFTQQRHRQTTASKSHLRQLTTDNWPLTTDKQPIAAEICQP